MKFKDFLKSAYFLLGIMFDGLFYRLDIFNSKDEKFFIYSGQFIANFNKSMVYIVFVILYD